MIIFLEIFKFALIIQCPTFKVKFKCQIIIIESSFSLAINVKFPYFYFILFLLRYLFLLYLLYL